MSQTTTILEQTATPQSITLKFNDSSSSSNPNNPTVDSKPDHENQPIRIPNVDPQTEAAVNEFLRRRGSTDENVRTGAMNDLRSFVERQEMEMETLVALGVFAFEMNDSELKDVFLGRIAERITDKSVEEVRGIFNITSDFTPEEEQAVRDENPWAFED
ncbi:hypothetical protein SSX86_009866 [Deinandra increscens subsp. villosa]|uniref:SKP1 component dimerisation domain-containing protein n=1 Tax=Deinandra increscens subsp. villosa TaxID=3103831 RepID=A0AAP0DE59_9ASTR